MELLHYIHHSKKVYLANYTPLDLNHQKFAGDRPLTFGSGYINCKLSLTSVLGSMFAIYTFLLCFIHT